jgi:hypothetical protein
LGERQNIVTVAVHVVGDRAQHEAAPVVGVDLLFSLAPPSMIGSGPWLTMMQSPCRRFISMAFLAYMAKVVAGRDQ